MMNNIHDIRYLRQQSINKLSHMRGRSHKIAEQRGRVKLLTEMELANINSKNEDEIAKHIDELADAVVENILRQAAKIRRARLILVLCLLLSLGAGAYAALGL